MSDKIANHAEVKEPNDPWLPMVVIALAQMLMSFNVSAIPVSMSGMVNSFNTPPTTVATAVVMYSLGVSGFVMLGAKLGQRFGIKRFFQVAVGLFLVAMALMVLSPTAGIMLAAQGLAGLAGASLVPTLVALIANHYRGQQQAKAVGWLGSARAIAGVLAFVIVGYVAQINWRLAFGLLVVHAAAILLLSFKLKPSTGDHDVKIDGIGVVLAAVGIILITFGFNNLRDWGVFLARPKAPFDIFGVSPAPAMITIGAALFMGFFSWSNQTAKANATYDKAIEIALGRLGRNSKDSDAMGKAATAYAKEGKLDRALQFIRSARSIDARDNDLMYREAVIHALAGQRAEAFGSLKSALENGYSAIEAKLDPDLKILRDMPEFQSLLTTTPTHK